MASRATSMIKGTVSLPFFDPEAAEAKISPRAWLQLVELARISAGTTTGTGDQAGVQVSNWTDEQMVTNCILLFRGSASRWAEILLEKQDSALKSWLNFKRLFRQRFEKSLTLSEKLALTDLHQKHTESVDQFHDRCTNNLNQYFEAEWEVLTVDQEEAGFPWGDPGKKVTDDHVKVSKNYYRQAIKLQVRLLFASGLRSDIKKQTLMQTTPGQSLEDIVTIAKRVEASLREAKKEVSAVDFSLEEDEAGDVEDLEAAAVNRRGYSKPGSFQNRGQPQNRGPVMSGGQGGSKNSCFYCLKGGHFKKECLSMKNDRAKGIFRTNINDPLSKKRQAASMEVSEEQVQCATAEASLQLQDALHYLNQWSV